MNSKKSNKKQILLSVLALLVILLVGAGVTYSWIEGGTTYTILTENNGDVKTGANPYLNTTVKKNIKLDPSDNGATITLASYDHNANKDQELYFSPVLSANGSDFFFPTAFDSAQNAISYRKANTNDIGTKFINYKFNVKAEKKCYVAFKETPKITATKSNINVSGTSAFRIMLRSGDERVVFTTGATEVQTPVVTDVNGTAGKLTAKPVSKYEYALDGTNKIFSYDAGDEEEMEVSVWLDGVTASDELVGSDVNLDMELIVAEEKVNIRFDAVTYSNTGSTLSNGFTGGSIDGNTKPFSRPYVFNSNISAKATANTNYEFKGWYSDEACTQEVTSSATITEPATVATTYYAKFVEKPKYTITVASKTLPSGTGGTVTVNGSGTTYTGYKDSSVNISAVEASGYVFDGWYSDANCTTNIGDNIYMTKSQSVKISANKTYYAKFVKQCVVTIMSVTDDNINDQSGGKVGIALDTDSNLDVNYTTATKIVKYKTPVKLSATPNKGFEFKGIKLESGSTTWVTDTLTQTITDDVTYYAYFETKPESTTTIYFEDRGYAKHCAFVYNDADSSIKYPEGASWVDGVAGGSVLELDDDTGLYKLTFTTADIGSFRVIINDSGNSQIQYPTTNNPGLIGDIGKTYLFKAGSPSALEEFNPDDLIEFKVVGTTGGSVAINGGGTSVKVVSGTSVQISATPNSNYEFAGWYTNSACTTTIGSTFKTATQNVSATATTYYAKFVKKTQYTITVASVTTPSGTGGTVTVNGSGTTYIGYKDSTVTISAVASNGYAFAGWYTDEACNTNIGSNIFMTATQSVTVNSNKTYYAKFVQSTVSTRNVYFDSSSCTWFGGDGAVLGVSTNGGSSYTKANSVTYSGKKYWYFALPDNVTSFKVGRVVGSSVYNAFDITTNGTNNLYIINSNHNGGEWKRLVHFDSSSCSWFGGDGAVLGVSTNGGSSYNSATSFSYNSNNYWYYVLPSNTTSFNVGRKVSSGTYNTFSINISGKNDFLKINNNCDGGTWAVFNP